MNPWLIDAVGIAGALLTTFCWLPQVLKIVRDRDTRAISFPANLACAVGVGCWLIYGAALPAFTEMYWRPLTMKLMGPEFTCPPSDTFHNSSPVLALSA